MGVSVGTRPNNVASIINSFNNPPPKPKPEAEKSCQVKNNWAKSADDSIHIFTKTWQPIGVLVHSVVVFVHDIVEHCERYQPLFVLFAGKGIEVQAFDLPGFGETGARADSLGITGGYDVLLKEIDNALNRALTARPSKPIILMGHGMGGALVLNYVCGLGQRITSLAGIIVSSPYLKPAFSGAGTRFPGTYNRLGKWYPNISVSFQVSPQELTRDHAEQERHHGDGLIRDSVSLRCLGDMIYQGQKMLKKRWKQFPLALPTLLLHGTEDPICSYQATSALNTMLQKLEPTNLKFKSWKGNKHDPHWDLDADAVRSEYIHWIRNISRNYVKPPLESDMVHTDTANLTKSTGSLGSLGKRVKRGKRSATTTTTTTTDQQTDSSASNSKGKTNVKDKPLSSNDPQQQQQQQQQQTAPTTPTPSGASAAEPEAIQDLAGLRRQQELKLQRAMQKRQEYNLLSNGENTTTTTADGDEEEDEKAISGGTAAASSSEATTMKTPERASDTDPPKLPSSTSTPSFPSSPSPSVGRGSDAAKTDHSPGKISTLATSVSTLETTEGGGTAAGVTHLTTPNAAGVDRSTSAPNLVDATKHNSVYLATPSTRGDHSASAPNLADLAAAVMSPLTPTHNLRAHRSGSAPSLAETAIGTMRDTTSVTGTAPTNQATEVLPRDGSTRSTLIAVTDEPSHSSVTSAREKTCVNDGTGNDTDTQETFHPASEQQMKTTREPSIVVHAAPDTTTSTAATTTNANAAEHTNLRDPQDG
ncbi:hypothetical protein EC968_005445 [Mortierella alpina]|nr:hypothetical protein EC968_005445 [Mortierella alpina]